MFSKSKYTEGQKEAIERKIVKAIREKLDEEISIGYNVTDKTTEIYIYLDKETYIIRNAFERKLNKIVEVYKNHYSSFYNNAWVIRIPTKLLYDEIFTVNEFKL